MARTYYVKHAQQRYATKPVLDPATGEQKRTPKMRRGVQMMTKTGRPIFLSVTERDYAKPLPMPKCSKCGKEIAVGQPYKYTETYSRTLVRCDTCPVPQPWEYSSSLSARTAQIVHEAQAALDAAEDKDSLESARDDFASTVRELAEEKEGSADNMEDGFGHETEQSNELREVAEQLSTWADDIEGVDFPEDPEPEEEDCPQCNGEGTLYDDDGENEEECQECEGTGQVTPDEPSEDQMSEWLDEARTALQEQIDGCPV